MANLRLKKTILEVVDNQLKANDPPCTKDVYEKLQNAGYSKSEAKDKIGAVVLTEIYDIMKEGKPFDEEKYKNALEKMLQQSIDYEDNHHIETEWDKWDDLVNKGYDCIEDEQEEGLSFWQEAWKIFCFVMEQNPKTDTIYALIDDLDYVYPIEEWLLDYELELGSAGKYEERIALCQKVLELFDWSREDDGFYRSGIGESLFGIGKIKEAYEYYEKWLAEDPYNVEGINSFSFILLENGDAERAYEIVRKMTWRKSCDAEHAILFMRGKQLAAYIGKEEESKWYQRQLDQFDEMLTRWEMGEKQMPIVKEKKIYPNDPCPCGSGKKYKKCCGRK